MYQLICIQSNSIFQTIEYDIRKRPTLGISIDIHVSELGSCEMNNVKVVYPFHKTRKVILKLNFKKMRLIYKMQLRIVRYTYNIQCVQNIQLSSKISFLQRLLSKLFGQGFNSSNRYFSSIISYILISHLTTLASYPFCSL